MSERPLITCRQLIDFIADYVDGELDEASRHEFERHLAVCRSCQAYLQTYRETMGLVRETANDDPLDDVPDELIRTILSRRR